MLIKGGTLLLGRGVIRLARDSFSAAAPEGAAMEEFTLSHMVAKQRHEAGECSFLCSFCLAEAEDYLRKLQLAEEEGDCVKRISSLCDCKRCKGELDLGEERSCALCFETFISFAGHKWCDSCRIEMDKMQQELCS